MDFIDYMILKLVIVFVAYFIAGLTGLLGKSKDRS